jgi:hypothetical protein
MPGRPKPVPIPSRRGAAALPNRVAVPIAPGTVRVMKLTAESPPRAPSWACDPRWLAYSMLLGAKKPAEPSPAWKKPGVEKPMPGAGMVEPGDA